VVQLLNQSLPPGWRSLGCFQDTQNDQTSPYDSVYNYGDMKMTPLKVDDFRHDPDDNNDAQKCIQYCAADSVPIRQCVTTSLRFTALPI
jgi:hypothetical protein